MCLNFLLDPTIFFCLILVLVAAFLETLALCTTFDSRVSTEAPIFRGYISSRCVIFQGPLSK